MMRKIAILATACLTVSFLVAAGINMMPKILAQESMNFEKLAQSEVGNATGSEKTFVGILSCNTPKPDFSQPLEGMCDFTVLVPSP